MSCIVAGRSRKRVEALGAEAGVPQRVCSVDDTSGLAAMLEGVGLVINAAGPFAATAPGLARACVAAGVHYLDISGEYRVIESLASLDYGRARAREVVVMPSVGFDVLASDCLAAMIAPRLPGATHLRIALRGLNAISRGSAQSVVEQYADMVVVRRNGRLARIPPGAETRWFDFGSGPVETTAVDLGRRGLRPLHHGHSQHHGLLRGHSHRAPRSGDEPLRVVGGPGAAVSLVARGRHARAARRSHSRGACARGRGRRRRRRGCGGPWRRGTPPHARGSRLVHGDDFCRRRRTGPERPFPARLPDACAWSRGRVRAGVRRRYPRRRAGGTRPRSWRNGHGR